MPRIDAVVSCPIHDSFRVQQVAGMFDVPLLQRLTERFSVDVPQLDEPWRIGLITGPSGSGKTTIARKWFGFEPAAAFDWPSDRAVVDCFGDLPIKQITGLLTAVGFGSPPSWVKPYAVLSNGEKFRCDLARTLGGFHAVHEMDATHEVPRPLIVFDEFTSVVDRNVAQIGSAALARAIKSDLVNCRFVAVTCHHDVAEWLEPDWVLDMATGEFQWRRLRRPEIRLEICRCHRSLWSMFARHHYLTGSLPRAVRCFVAKWKNAAVAFCATVSLIGHKRRWRISRLVTLPDYQGVGIGMRFAEAVALLHAEQGERINITAAHPALVKHCHRSTNWRAVSILPGGSRRAEGFQNYRGSAGRTVVSFEFIARPEFEAT